MRHITFDEFKGVVGISDENLKRLRAGNHLALAFGRGEAYPSLGYVELDVVASVLATMLNGRGMDRALAAQIVRLHWPTWTRAVATAEALMRHKQAPPICFIVISVVDRKGQTGHVVATSQLTDAAAIVDATRKIAKGCRPVASTAVSINDALMTVREKAAVAGYDWLDAFLPPLDDPNLAKLLRDGDAALDRAVKEARTDKEKEAIARRAGIVARATIEESLPESTL